MALKLLHSLPRLGRKIAGTVDCYRQVALNVGQQCMVMM
jgi:hypothetical protein